MKLLAHLAPDDDDANDAIRASAAEDERCRVMTGTDSFIPLACAVG